MKKDRWVYKLKKRFGFPDNAKFVFFQNPDCFGRIDIERINPTHKIDMIAKPKKQFAKSKPRNKMRIGRINIPIFVIINNQIEKLIYLFDKLNFTDNIFLMMSYFLFSCVFVFILLNLTGICQPMKFMCISRLHY